VDIMEVPQLAPLSGMEMSSVLGAGALITLAAPILFVAAREAIAVKVIFLRCLLIAHLKILVLIQQPTHAPTFRRQAERPEQFHPRMYHVTILGVHPNFIP
jgi:hypothetical protein